MPQQQQHQQQNSEENPSRLYIYPIQCLHFNNMKIEEEVFVFRSLAITVLYRWKRAEIVDNKVENG
jgi:hypothetical protein